MITLGKQLQAMRIIRGYNQAKFARSVGYTPQTYSSFENDHVIPPDDRLREIKAALGWPSDDQAEVAFGILAGKGANNGTLQGN